VYLDKFHNVIQPALIWNRVWRAVREKQECDLFRRIIKSRTDSVHGLECFIEWRRLDPDTLAVLQDDDEDTDGRKPIREWVPGELVLSLAPALFQQYQSATKQKSERKTPSRRYKQPRLTISPDTP
jgi:hypothetical protein